MDQLSQRLLALGNAERLVDALSEGQHLKPHQAVSKVVDAIVQRFGVCPDAASHALVSLQINRDLSIGRLRRSELIQLGRALLRNWRQAVVERYNQSQPA